MNNLLSIFQTQDKAAAAATTLDKFFEEIESVKDDLKQVDCQHKSSNTFLALKNTNLIKLRLDSLDNVTATRCSPGTAAYRTRTTVVSAHRNNLRNQIKNIQEGRQQTYDEFAVLEMGEVKERWREAADIEKGLVKLQQVFVDMAVVVAAQGEEVNDIESQMKKAKSYIERGAEELTAARNYLKSSRKWMCCCYMMIFVLMLIILFVILLIFLKYMGENNNQMRNNP